MVMATVFVALPLVIREVVPVLEEIGDDQEQAARSLGANAVQTFRRITLPSIKWAVVYGVVLSLARSLGEFGAVRSSPATSSARPRPPRSSSSRSTRTSSRPTAYAIAVPARARRRSSASSSSSCILRPERGAELMSIEITDVNKRFGDFVALDDVSRQHPDRPAHRAARPERRRQVDAAADHRRPGVRRRRARSRSRASTPPTCRRRSATSASCSSTTPRSST